MVNVFCLSSRAVAKPWTKENRSGEYSLKPSSIARNIFDSGTRSGLTTALGAAILKKRWEDGDMRVILYVFDLFLDSSDGIIWRRR